MFGWPPDAERVRMTIKAGIGRALLRAGMRMQSSARGEAEIEKKSGHAISVVCDLSDITSARQAAAQIIARKLPIAGVVNSAGMGATSAARSAQGWNLTFATNQLGPFAFTEELIPHLPDGTNVVFICSGVEDPERRPATMAGFRGGRYISAKASARGEWQPGGSSQAGADAYATSK